MSIGGPHEVLPPHGSAISASEAQEPAAHLSHQSLLASSAAMSDCTTLVATDAPLVTERDFP